MKIYVAVKNYYITTQTNQEPELSDLTVGSNSFKIVTTPKELLSNEQLVKILNLDLMSFLNLRNRWYTNKKPIDYFCVYLSAFNPKAPELLPDTVIVIWVTDKETQIKVANVI